MTVWRAYPTSTQIRMHTVMAIAEMVQAENYPISPFQQGDEIQFDGPTEYIGTGFVDGVDAGEVTFTINNAQFMMSRNSKDDFPSNTKSDLRIEDWTVREAL